MDETNRHGTHLSDSALEQVSGGTGCILKSSDFDGELCRLTEETGISDRSDFNGEKTDENLSTLCGLVGGQSSFISSPTTITPKE